MKKLILSLVRRSVVVILIALAFYGSTVTGPDNGRGLLLLAVFLFFSISQDLLERGFSESAKQKAILFVVASVITVAVFTLFNTSYDSLTAGVLLLSGVWYMALPLKEAV